jgi:RND superfamily putative drug exporter
VQFFVPISTAGDVGETVTAVRESIEKNLPTGLEAWVTGPAGFTADLVAGFLGIDGSCSPSRSAPCSSSS